MSKEVPFFTYVLDLPLLYLWWIPVPAQKPISPPPQPGPSHPLRSPPPAILPVSGWACDPRLGLSQQWSGLARPILGHLGPSPDEKQGWREQVHPESGVPWGGAEGPGPSGVPERQSSALPKKG